jgi:hypothetical protein
MKKSLLSLESVIDCTVGVETGAMSWSSINGMVVFDSEKSSIVV